MWKLLKKEFGLTTQAATYLFIASAFMAFIPNYPILVSVFFLSLGIMTTFQCAGESNDILYLALLPVQKRDTVKAKFLMVNAIELIHFVLVTAIVIFRFLFMSNSQVYSVNPLLNANVAFLGYLLISYAIFNFFFLKLFFNTAVKYGKPFLIYSIIEFVFIGIAEAVHHLPNLTGLNSINGDGMGLQAAVLSIGIAVYLLVNFVSFFLSAKKFEKIDL